MISRCRSNAGFSNLVHLPWIVDDPNYFAVKGQGRNDIQPCGRGWSIAVLQAYILLNLGHT